ncbi:PVC-type heme-binding CxxCH protein [Membranihabitans marinus]|uniref:PVC-type heme-binding CxxCH protein n=1 Tax=Membranihabitans marinus TaxID=1227546 RepID=UPI001F1DF460|nr:PVC-type heme-binding CxxCH protein [Membranihabitans marinus]
MYKNIYYIFLSTILILSHFQCNQSPRSEDISFSSLDEEEKRWPENALKGIQLADDVEVALFANEPMLINPTNIDVDHRGRVYVCEAYNYRNRLTGNPVKTEGDRILILTDTDGDGQADDQKVFYQDSSLQAPIGIMVLGHRVLVSQSPYVWLLTDEDGDDVADKKEIIFQGIEGVQHDHGVHAFVFGPDGKFYFNFGNEGKQLLDKEGQPVKDKYGQVIDFKKYRHGMVFRCDQNFENLEILGHNFRNPYEVAIDSYGTMWQSDNDDDGNRGVRINYVMDYGNYGFRDEITGGSWREYRTNMEDSIPYRHWHLNDPGVVPNVLQTGAGSPTGILVYEGDMLSDKYRNQLIHCDAGPNVLRSYSISNQGSGYTAAINNIMVGEEDQWFRPSDVCVAPDGSLLVSDWYDPGVGGHQVGDLTRGRLYRVSTNTSSYKPVEVDWTQPAGALLGLQSPNQSIRYHSWNSLHTMGNKAEAVLASFFKDTSQPSRMRARTLWLLAQMNGKGESYIDMALADTDANIRITGIRAVRQFLPDLIVEKLMDLSSEADSQVLREMAVSLYNQSGDKADALWNSLVEKYDGSDRWFLEALGIGGKHQWSSRMKSIYSKPETEVLSKYKDLVWRSRTENSLPYLISLASDRDQSVRERLRYLRAIDFVENESAKNKALLKIVGQANPSEKDELTTIILRQIDPGFFKQSTQAQAMVNDMLIKMKGSKDYFDLIERFDIKTENSNLASLLNPEQALELRQRAVHLLMKNNGFNIVKQHLNAKTIEEKISTIEAVEREVNGDVRDVLISMVENKNTDLAVRDKAVYTLGASYAGREWTLSALENNELDSALVLMAVQGLNNSRDRSIQLRAAKFLKQSDNQHPPIEELVLKTGNRSEGKLVFEQHCGLCHQVGDMGNDFGPNLSQIGRKLPKLSQYTAIFYPSAGISFGYEGQTLTFNDGNSTTGIVVSRTENQIVLKFPGGSQQTYNMSDIKEIEEETVSMMPSGLQNAMTTDKLVDLVEFLVALK